MGLSRNQETESKLVVQKKITSIPSVLVALLENLSTYFTYFNPGRHACDKTPMILDSFLSMSFESKQLSLAEEPLVSTFSPVELK